MCPNVEAFQVPNFTAFSTTHWPAIFAAIFAADAPDRAAFVAANKPDGTADSTSH